MDPRFALGLDRNVDSTVKRLDQMLAQLEGYRPLLEQNVACAEFDIKATFGGLINALAQRQTQLLKQLDKAANEKLNVINSQKQMIENLRSDIIACISDRNKNIGQIQENLSRAESAVISSSSAPFVSFRTEKPIMHRTISNYGRIISQYCGHFADPSQPSSCLPRALEEEDDNEESVEYGYHTQSMVLHPFHMQPRVKPELLQWLSEEHNVDFLNHSRMDQKLAYHMTSKTSTGKFSVESQDSTSSRVTKSSLSQVNATYQTPVPFRACDSLMLRHWLDTSASLKGLDNIREQNVRKFSQATSFGAPDIAGGTDSESFILMTGSNGGGSAQSDALKDRMFFDALELTEIQGLFESGQPRPLLTAANQVDLQRWLAPASNTQSSNFQGSFDRLTTDVSVGQKPRTRSRLDSLLPAHLTQTDLKDMDQWLAKSPQSDTLPVQAEQSGPVSALNADSESKTDNFGPSEILPTINSELVTKDNKQMQYDCIYSQCRGGPGGPSCCGARGRNEKFLDCLAPTEDSSVVECAMPVPTPTAIDEASTQLNHDKSGENLASVSKKADTNPIVDQLRNIASTPLSQWLVESSALPRVTPPTVDRSKCSVSDSCSLDLKTWIHLDSAVYHSDDVSSEDSEEPQTPVIPSKCWSYSVTNDCLGCPCSDEVFQGVEVPPARASSIKESDELDLWLLKKLSVH